MEVKVLRQLEIQNIALIDRVSIGLGNGLNVMTGETGAGKSIIIDSINAVLGERMSKEIIRTGKDKALVEAVFQVENEKLKDIFESFGIEPEEDDTLIISREFNITGKSLCRINGKMATVSMLKEIGQYIIDIHGQYDNQSLLRVESHIKLLDSFGGEKIQELKREYSQLLDRYKELKRKLKDLTGDSNERERRIDLLKYQIEEIKKADLRKNEEALLNSKRLLLANAEKVISVLSGTYELLYSGSNLGSSVTDYLNQALTNLNSILKLDDKFVEISKNLEDLKYQLEDISEELRSQRDQTDYNPNLLEEIEERIDLIFKLKRKYGNSVEEILTYCKKIENELEDILGSEELVVSLTEELDSVDDKLYHIAKSLNNERINAAKILEAKIGQELCDLEMKRAEFKASIVFEDFSDQNTERKYQHSGLDKVEFLISANAGEPLKPLSKIASGGEMSRIMLAIKTILANVDEMPTLIFDEIDIGVSGRAAQKVGEKLSLVSKNHQVICVTHLAQIASMADNHFLIEKVSNEKSTYTEVKKLNEKTVILEIARIIGGVDISEITLKHAEEMLHNAQKIKV